MPDGLLVIDKPEGPTSHDVVARARRVLHQRRIGHTGTLDPLATGVLPLLIGRATRLARFLTADDKQYLAEVRFGEATSTYDRHGETIGEVVDPYLTRSAIETALEAFRGTRLQTPPPYSAKKIGGVSAHRLARRGEPPVLAAVTVTARELELVELAPPDARLAVRCSAGYYVRSLAHDLGAALGCGAHVRSLRRTASGAITLEAAVPLDALEAQPALALARIQPLSTLLPTWPAVHVTAAGAARVRRGGHLGRGDCDLTHIQAAIQADAGEPGSGADDGPEPGALWVRVLDPAGELLALAVWSEDASLLHPRVVLVYD